MLGALRRSACTALIGRRPRPDPGILIGRFVPATATATAIPTSRRATSAVAAACLASYIKHGRPRHVKTSRTQGDILHGVNDAQLERYAERRPEILNCVGAVQP